jgi:hypothetical protein
VNGDEGRHGVFDGVVVAVGTCAKMSIPHIQGLGDFGGQTCHSSQLESVDVRGKKVVIVGGGASAVEAMEFAVDNGAASVAVVSRVSSSRNRYRNFVSSKKLTSLMSQSDKWVIPRWRLLNCLMAAVIFDPLGVCEKVIEWILRFFYYRDLPAGAMPKSLKVFSKTPVCSDRFFDLLVSPDASEKPILSKPPVLRTDTSTAFRHGPMAESRLPASRRLRPGNQTPRPTIINTIGKTALPNSHPRALPNPHLRNRLHPPSPPHHYSSYQNLNNPRTLLLVPPSLPSLASHNMRPK